MAVVLCDTSFTHSVLMASPAPHQFLMTVAVVRGSTTSSLVLWAMSSGVPCGVGRGVFCMKRRRHCG